MPITMQPSHAPGALPARYLLVVNSQSGNWSAAAEAELVAAFASADLSLARVLRLPEEPLPTRAGLEAAGIDGVAIYTGDGTINTLAEALSGWNGAILVLPGGTLNLLSKALHGDAVPADILARIAGGGAFAAALPVATSVIDGRTRHALVSLIAGDTTAWGEVRAALRERDVGAIVRSAREALGVTLSPPAVTIDGVETPYQAVNVTARPDGLDLTAFVNDGAIDLLRHGAAWMGGDFRDGPHDRLDGGRAVTIRAAAGLGIQIDGELVEWATDGAGPPTVLEVALARSTVPFIRTIEAA